MNLYDIEPHYLVLMLTNFVMDLLVVDLVL